MYKKKIYVFIYLSIMLSVLLSAAPLDKYYIPQQSSGYTTQTAEPDIYAEFRNKISNMSLEDRNKLKESFEKKRDEAKKINNFDAAKYYQQLIDILNS